MDMSYSNSFLRDFRPIFLGILREKNLSPAQVAVEVIDEEPRGQGIFEPVSVKDVLGQLTEDLNFLTIYTERPAYFYEFAETMYEENGLVVTLFSKMEGMRARKQQISARARQEEESVSLECGERKVFGTLVLDFEWEGTCHFTHIGPERYYIPIHKKPWKQGENLDIIVPIGYNTVIVKGIQKHRKKPSRDRFEEAFYS